MEREPRKEVAEMLTKIANVANHEPHTLWTLLFNSFVGVFTTSEVVTEHSPAGRKAGIRAALLLASWNDPRSLKPLALAFETDWFWQGSYQDAIETALHRFLSNPDNHDLEIQSEPLRILAQRVWRSGGVGRELAPRRADIIQYILKILSKMDEPANVKLIQAIAVSKARTPNRSRVKAAASRLLSA